MAVLGASRQHGAQAPTACALPELPPASEFKAVTELRKAVKAALVETLNAERVARGKSTRKHARAHLHPVRLPERGTTEAALGAPCCQLACLCVLFQGLTSAVSGASAYPVSAQRRVAYCGPSSLNFINTSAALACNPLRGILCTPRACAGGRSGGREGMQPRHVTGASRRAGLPGLCTPGLVAAAGVGRARAGQGPRHPAPGVRRDARAAGRSLVGLDTQGQGLFLWTLPAGERAGRG